MSKSPPVPTYRRPLLETVLGRLREAARHMQVLVGPRQVGKTTLAHQAIFELMEEGWAVIYATADGPPPEGADFLRAAWDSARREKRDGTGALLVLDEVQKVPGWAEAVKREWDADRAAGTPLRVLLLGSSALLVRRGLAESLAGRFELLRATHWTLPEMAGAFGFDVDRFVYFGGFPGAATLVGDRARWAQFVLDALIEPVLGRDVLGEGQVRKPALLRRLLYLCCEHSAEILSYSKMLGQLHETGNTTTLAHYLQLLEAAGMVAGLSKHAGRRVRQRASPPKLLALNTALVSASAPVDFAATRADGAAWGRLVETAVGAHLRNGAELGSYEVAYWREGDREVDFVVRRGRSVTAIEVKSGRARPKTPGFQAFRDAFGDCRPLLIGTDGVPLEEFLGSPPDAFLA